jgi:type II secretory pathway component PulF
MPFLAHTKIAEQLEDLASRLDAGLSSDLVPGETLVASLRQKLALSSWEWTTLVAAEDAGSLPVVLRQVAEAQRQRAQLRRELLGALAYPALVLSLCALVACIVLASGAAPTGWLVATGSALLFVLAGLGWLAWRLKDPALDGDRMPFVGRISRSAGEVPYLVALRALYAAGVPLRRAHAEAAAAAPVPWVRARLFVASRALEAGQGLAAALEGQRALTGESLTLIRDGETAGQLEDALARASRRRQDELARTLRRTARIVGTLAYAYAALSVLWIAVRFYGSMYGRL